MTIRSVAAGRKKQNDKRKELMKNLWGKELDNIQVWNRHEYDGYTTMPRTFPHIARMMDSLAGKGTPISQTYLALWCRVFDEGFLEIKDKEDLAYEAGFSGQRAIYSLAQRMRKLKDLGFIKAQSKAHNEFQYVLIVNPFFVIQEMGKSSFRENEYNLLLSRMGDVGAKWPKDNDRGEA